MMSNSISISRLLLHKTIELLDCLDVDDLAPDAIQLFGFVLNAFNIKKAHLELSDAFAVFIRDNDLPPPLLAHSDFMSTYFDEPF